MSTNAFLDSVGESSILTRKTFWGWWGLNFISFWIWYLRRSVNHSFFLFMLHFHAHTDQRIVDQACSCLSCLPQELHVSDNICLHFHACYANYCCQTFDYIISICVFKAIADGIDRWQHDHLFKNDTRTSWIFGHFGTWQHDHLLKNDTRTSWILENMLVTMNYLGAVFHVFFYAFTGICRGHKRWAPRGPTAWVRLSSKY